MRSVLVLLLPFAALSQSLGDDTPKGLWLTARKDSRNQARADVPGRMTGPPEEVWRMPTGGQVFFARRVRVDGEDLLLLQVGSTLELARRTGERVWRRLKLGVGLVLRVDDFDGDGRPEVLVRTDVRSVALLDVATGELLWSWKSAPSTQVIGRAFHRTLTGLRFICFPSYSVEGFCFDFSGDCRNPDLLWHRDFQGKYAAGYGPNIVLKDMDGDGKLDIVLSGKAPSVSQLVVDVDTGEVKVEAHHDLGGWGRPYGLLHAADLDADGYPDVVMVCCQVEEYICVARNVGGERLEKMWGHFVEKDWPTDEKELRPQATSVADLRGNEKPELVVGLWDGERWGTLIIDPLEGFEAQRGALEGLYFWGCHDLTGDGRPEIICSREERRRPSRVSDLLAIDGMTLQPVAALESAAVFASGDSPMPEDTHFMALRRSPAFIRAGDGTAGILVRRFHGERETGVYLWGAKPSGEVGTRRVAGPEFARIHLYENELLLSDAGGRVQRFGPRPKPVGRKLATNGRACGPLVWGVEGKRELVVDVAGGEILGGAPDLIESGKLDGAWRLPGSYPALHIDANGVGRLAVADSSDPTKPEALVYTSPLSQESRPLRIELSDPVLRRAPFVPHGEEGYSLLVNLQTGVHTLAFATYDASGKLLWADEGWGAYPNTAAAADLTGDGRFEVIADDHGNYRVYNAEGSVIASHPGWPPAYNVPIIGPFAPDGKTAVLRSAGINGMALLDAGANQLWLKSARVWQYYGGFAAVGDVAGNGKLALGIVNEEGVFECIDAGSGETLWTLDLGVLPNSTSVVAGDLNGDGRDEFLTGLPDGRLVCIGEGETVWEKELDAAIANPIIADVDGDGLAEIALSTSDGCVRILR